MTDVSKEEVERRAMEAARRLLTTPKAAKTPKDRGGPEPGGRPRETKRRKPPKATG